MITFKTCVYSVWVLYCGGKYNYVHFLETGQFIATDGREVVCQDYPGPLVNSKIENIIGGIGFPEECFIQVPACRCE